jgi:hypothetical protein
MVRVAALGLHVREGGAVVLQVVFLHDWLTAVQRFATGF